MISTLSKWYQEYDLIFIIKKVESLRENPSVMNLYKTLFTEHIFYRIPYSHRTKTILN